MYNLFKIMTRAWRNFRKGGMSFAEALHRSWLSAKAEPINARRIAEALHRSWLSTKAEPVNARRIAEALHRSWMSAKAEPINARRVAEAQAGVTEQVQTWAGWKTSVAR